MAIRIVVAVAVVDDRYVDHRDVERLQRRTGGTRNVQLRLRQGEEGLLYGTLELTSPAARRVEATPDAHLAPTIIGGK